MTSFVLSLMLKSALLASLFISLSHATPSVMVADDVLKDICFGDHNRNPTLCMQVLKSDPRTAKADLQGLAQIAIDITGPSVNDGYELVRSLVNQTTDPLQKSNYVGCLDMYDLAKGNVQYCYEALRSRDYGALNSAGSMLYGSIATCEISFDGPPAAPSLQKKNTEVVTFSDIIKSVSDRLMN